MKVSVAFVLAAVAVTNAISIQQQFLGSQFGQVEDRRPASIDTFNNVISQAINRELYAKADGAGLKSLFKHGCPGGGHHDGPPHDHPGHGKPPHHPSPPGHGKPDKPPHPPGREPWPPRRPDAPPGHPHHFDMNLYDLLAAGNVTSKFFSLIKDDKDIKEMLSDTSKNFTILVPINEAFGVPPHFDNPHHAPDFRGPQAHSVASYHILPGHYDFYNLNLAKTLETFMEVPELGSKDAHQRVRIGREVEEGFGEGPNPCRKTAINVLSKVISADFFGTNGVVHAISHILLPPPPTTTLIHLFPTEFSTWMLAVWKSGMIDAIEDLAGTGLTIFPPSNRRWEELPWDIRTFLFSPHGEKYLKALVQYHIVPKLIQYTDEVFHADTAFSYDLEVTEGEDVDSIINFFKKGFFKKRPHGPNPGNWPRGKYHRDLPTLLEGKSISVDIMREGPWAKWRLNGGTGLFPNDIVSREGVIQVPRGVLFPPRTDKPPRVADFDSRPDSDIPTSIEDLKARFKGLVEE
ncbi:FAS1 domain-containing protein [Ascobolus immersus RN42]|uniref:FAS1 domain-containing protein n=1 Tax=Ascobolus immersus RN42 TaxID=1160509 RepID=A0A3N4II28_ASCIM|nr:FAS1 domain-containing protein [Ascobolus immersus RN42]